MRVRVESCASGTGECGDFPRWGATGGYISLQLKLRDSVRALECPLFLPRKGRMGGEKHIHPVVA